MSRGKSNPAKKKRVAAVRRVRKAIVFGRKSSLSNEEVAACVGSNSKGAGIRAVKICEHT